MRSITKLVGVAAGFALAITAARSEAAPAEKRAEETAAKQPAPAAATAAAAGKAELTDRKPVLPAEVPPEPSPTAAPAPGFPGNGLGLLVEPRVGGFLPSGRLDPTASFGLQAGVILLPEKQLWVIAELGFSRPSVRGRGGTLDAPLGTFQYDLAVNDFSALLGSRMMFPTRFERFTPFAEAGLKLHVLHSESSGSSKSFGSFGDDDETSLAPGLALRGGAAYRLGPGAVSAGLEVGYARVGQVITGEVWYGGLGFYGGYLYAF